MTSLTDKILDIMLLNKKKINSDFSLMLDTVERPHEFLSALKNEFQDFILTNFNSIGKEFLRENSLDENDAVNLIKNETQMNLRVDYFEDFKNFIIRGFINPIEAYSLAYLINEMYLFSTDVEINFEMLNKFILKTLNVEILGIKKIDMGNKVDTLLNYEENLVTYDTAQNIKRLFNSKRDNYKRCPGISSKILEKIREIVFYLYDQNYKNYLIKNEQWQNTTIAISKRRNHDDPYAEEEYRQKLMRELPGLDCLHLGLILGRVPGYFGGTMGNLALREENNILLKVKTH